MIPNASVDENILFCFHGDENGHCISVDRASVVIPTLEDMKL